MLLEQEAFANDKMRDCIAFCIRDDLLYVPNMLVIGAQDFCSSEIARRPSGMLVSV